MQLSPNIAYEVQCSNDTTAVDKIKEEQNYLDKMLSKRMAQLDAELDSMLSEKFLLGLQTLFSQERFDLDLYLKYSHL